jgi:hypothetical protein
MAAQRLICEAEVGPKLVAQNIDADRIRCGVIGPE